MVSVTVKASMRHGDLHAALKKAGSMAALAELLGVSVATAGGWYRYQNCPPAIETLPHWPQAKIDDLEKRLFDLTGKLLDELFPEAVRSKEFLRMAKTMETTKEVEGSKLIAMANQVRGIQYREPDIIEQEELSEAVHASLGALSDRERQVVKMRYGLGCEPMTLKEVGKVLHVSGARISEIERKAMRKLQNPRVSGDLAGHLS